MTPKKTSQIDVSELLTGESEQPKEEIKLEEKPDNVVDLHSPEMFLMADKRDEEQIQAELMGMSSSEYAYAFRKAKGKGKDKIEVGPIMVDLSITGYSECRRRYGAIQFNYDHIKVDNEILDGFITVFLVAKDLKTGNECPGSGTCKIQDIYTRATDPFCIQKALSKAVRNATKGLLSQKLRLDMIRAHYITIARSHEKWTQLWMYPDWVKDDVKTVLEERGLNQEGKQTHKPVTSEKKRKTPATKPQLTRLYTIAFGHAIPNEDVGQYIDIMYGKKSSVDLTWLEVDELIQLMECHRFPSQLEHVKNKYQDKGKRTA